MVGPPEGGPLRFRRVACLQTFGPFAKPKHPLPPNQRAVSMAEWHPQL